LKHRAVAGTKRGGGEAVNAERHRISYKRACDRLLEIPAFRQSGPGVPACQAKAYKGGQGFVLIFLASFFLSRKRMKWGSG
jgi:hypothetical protein